MRVVDGGWIAARVAGKTPDLPYLAGLGLGVADVGATADLLAQKGLTFRRRAGSLLISPADACGAFIEFQPAL